jgi:hypothetical protein
MSGLVSSSASALLSQARRGWSEAAFARRPDEKFRDAHLAALRAAAAMLAARARPATQGRRRPTSAWVLLDAVAPEFVEWSAYFADTATRRAAIEAGSVRVVTEREADDLLRAAGEFIALVERAVLSAHFDIAS